MSVWLGTAVHTAQAQLDGFRSRTLQTAVRAQTQRDTYVAEWPAAVPLAGPLRVEPMALSFPESAAQCQQQLCHHEPPAAAVSPAVPERQARGPRCP